MSENVKLAYWRPIETAPRDGSSFLAYSTSAGSVVMKFNRFVGDDGDFVRRTSCRRCDGFTVGGLTHWMPLPESPDSD